MIGIYSTQGAAAAAGDLAGLLRRRWSTEDVVAASGADVGALPFVGGQGAADWDDLLLVLFGADGLPPALHAPIRQEVDAARQQGRASRVLPISTVDGHLRPPEPLEAVLAMHCPDLAGEGAERVARRVGALLWLWLRGAGRRIFISHRQADGKPLAMQLTDYLRRLGYDAWRDEEQLEGGHVVQDEIVKHVDTASLLLLLDTPKAKESDWIAQEVDAAIAGFVPILPVRLRPAEAAGAEAAAGVYATAELRTHRMTARFDDAGAVAPLTDDELAALLATLEDTLTSLLRDQRRLAAQVEGTFRDKGFTWRPVDERRALYDCSKQDEHFALVRMLSHCSAVSPRQFRAVRALQGYRVDGGGGRPLEFGQRLFIYTPPLARPELRRLVSDYGFDQDPRLRLIDAGRLADYLERI